MAALARWILVAVLSLLPPLAIAQETAGDTKVLLKTRMDAAIEQFEALREKQPAEALPHLITAVDLADQVYGFTHENTLRWRESLVRLYTRLDRPKDAAWITKVKEQRIEIDQAYKRYEALRGTDPAAALPHLEKVVSQIDWVYGHTHQATFLVRNALAELYRQLGREVDATKMSEATARRNEILQAYLRYIELRENNPSEALPYLETVVRLADDVFGSENFYTYQYRDDLAQLHRRLQRDADADRVLEGTKQRRSKAQARRDYVKAFQSYVALRDDKPAEALAHLETAVMLIDQVFGVTHETTIQTRNSLAQLYQQLERFDASERLFKATLARIDTSGSSPHAELAQTPDLLGFLHRDQRRYADAIKVFERALALSEQALGPEHEDIGWKLGFLASHYQIIGDYPAAETRFVRALEILEKALGPDSPDLANPLNNLAALFYDRGRFDQAIPLYRRSVDAAERKHGPEHPNVANNLNNLAIVYSAQGRLARAEELYLRALNIRENALGPNHADVANSLNSIAGLHLQRGDYDSAERRYKRVMALLEATLGRDHIEVAKTMNNLALVFKKQCRYEEARPIYVCALEILKKHLDNDHPTIAVARVNLATLYQSLNRLEDAEILLQQSLDTRSRVLRPDHPDVGFSMINLAALYLQMERFDQAETLLDRALEIFEKAFGPDHPQVSDVLNNLAGVYGARKETERVEPTLRRSIDILVNTFGEFHPKVAIGYQNLAVHHFDQGDFLKALQSIRRTTGVTRRRSLQASTGTSKGTQCKSGETDYGLKLHLRSVPGAYDAKQVASSVGFAEAFEVAQLIAKGGTASAVARMAARFAAGGDALAELVRKRQDAGDAWQRVDQMLIEAVSKPNAERDAENEKRLRDELAALDREIAFADRNLAVEFPAYRELSDPRPMKHTEVQKLLAPDEAVLVYTTSQDRNFIFVVRHDEAALWNGGELAGEIEEIVDELRETTDPTGVETLEDIDHFDIETSYELYQHLFAPAEPMLKGVRHLIVVPHGPLQSLPLGVLVTEEPEEPIDDFDAYRGVPWLAKKYALTTLPSVSSLKSLRLFAARARASKPFIGIGDPDFQGEAGAARGLAPGKLFTSRGLADTRAVASLPRLPDTADELRAIAGVLGGGETDMLLQDQARERVIKTRDLSDHQVVVFSTHGLMAGDFEGLGEPALALTPPEQATEEDDGLLTASEAAQLKLNADWVVLSAYNTAADDGTPGAEGLSGLAKAFFYAGARALLVSHWPVSSEAATRLTSRAFAIAKTQPELGRSRAFAQSMLDLMNDPEKTYFAHPMFWAPFSVIGEGGTFRPQPSVQ